MQKKIFIFSHDGGSREDWNPFYCPFVIVTNDDFNDPIFSTEITLASGFKHYQDIDEAVNEWVSRVKAKFPKAIVETGLDCEGIMVDYD